MSARCPPGAQGARIAGRPRINAPTAGGGQQAMLWP